jgi:hypothetical protein
VANMLKGDVDITVTVCQPVGSIGVVHEDITKAFIFMIGDFEISGG